jgi:hypothetical protein
VKVAVPVSGFSDLECYVTDEVINGHCDCMFAHNTYQWEWTTILALFAPKPMLFANSDMDRIFPMSGNRRIAERLRQCYKLLGAPNNFEDYVSKGGHDYRPDLRRAVFQFFETQLKGSPAQVTDELFEVIPGKDLRVFPEDKDLPKEAINAKVDETFVPVAKVELPEAGKFKEWKAGLVKQLREKCFRALPEKVPEAKPLPEPQEIETEQGIACRMTYVKRKRGQVGASVWVVLNPDESVENARDFWAKDAVDEAVLMGTYTRGGGPLRWTSKSPPNTIERSLVLVGQTADSGRVRDLISTFNRFRIGVTSHPKIVGKGPSGIIAAYAMLLTPGWTGELVIADSPLSHRDGPHFLNVLRVLDIPEALGLLAPDVKLTLIGKNAKDKAFDKTAAIYKLAGAEDKFRRE